MYLRALALDGVRACKQNINHCDSALDRGLLMDAHALLLWTSLMLPFVAFSHHP